jgi:hypothetical protein
MTITIGIDPHKASHTAVAIDNTECVIDNLQVRACAKQSWFNSLEFRQRVAVSGDTAVIGAPGTLAPVCSSFFGG